MPDSRRFIQLTHPGKEHGPECGGTWHRSSDARGRHQHQRKFMQVAGEWIDANGNSAGGLLWAWGEWEAQSTRLRDLDSSGGAGLPQRLWQPFYIAMSDYGQLHNTDPFIFGDRFLYSNCQQWSARRNGLRHLDRGSVIAFGSRVNQEWVLDTVMVVVDFIDYVARDVLAMLVDCTPEAFRAVSGQPIAHGESALRLYRGATPATAVEGMYSFFPAMPAGSESGFRRPSITLPDNYFGVDVQYAKGHKLGLPDVAPDELPRLWDDLVRQVRDADLVLGVAPT